MQTKEQAKENLIKLVARFKSEFESGKTDEYSEESTKKSFIEPLLEDVLGWDVSDHNEVTMEHRISRDRVDYGIKLKNKLVFFVEAKSIKYDLDKAIPQAVKYCYNRKDVPFILLTDFEGLMFFDAGFKPDLRYVKRGIKIDLNWKNYVEKFDELWQLSKAEVEAGSLDKLFTQKFKDRTSVDKDILEDLEEWREKLAKNIYKNNLDELFHTKDRDADSQYLKEITQKLLDRIIFIRFCEDKQLTQMQHLKPRFDSRGEATGLNTMYILRGIFKEYEAIFNSDLFAAKEWETDLKIEFAVVNKIIQQTYDPYMFDAIPLEILGNIYEQYLGYTIKLAGDSIKYELKPEVRKAGGVYYTPEYVVNYIVKNTVGNLLSDLSDVKAKKIRILDPACGSGTFLIRAYDELLHYYLKLKKKSKISVAKGQTAIETGEAGTRLSIEEKTKILKEHIYGVDLDSQAVEVTKLSLMLKMLEGEFGLVKGTHLLPMLDTNIRNGNSLVSGNTLELNKYFGADFHKIKPFNWEETFKDVMVNGQGFDVVIGNPPYVNLVALPEDLRKYLQSTFKTCKNKSDLYSFFIEKALSVVRLDKFKFGFIVPHTWLAIDSFSLLRKMLLENGFIESIAEMGFNVFDGVVVSTVILICSPKNKKMNVLNKDFSVRFSMDNDEWIKKNYEIDLEWNPQKQLIYDRLKSNTVTLDNIIQFSRGIKTSNDDKFILPNKKNVDCKKIFRGRNLKAYEMNWENEYIWYRPDLMREKVGCLPHTKEFFEVPEKIVTQRVNSSMQLLVAYDDEMNYFLDTVNVSRYETWDKVHSLKYICGLLNSKLLNYWYCNKYKMPTIGGYELHSIPIRKIDFDNADDKSKYDRIISLTELIIEQSKKTPSRKGSELEQLCIQIQKSKDEIDRLVYGLYDLDESEIEIIENKMKQNVRLPKAE